MERRVQTILKRRMNTNFILGLYIVVMFLFTFSNGRLLAYNPDIVYSNEEAVLLEFFGGVTGTTEEDRGQWLSMIVFALLTVSFIVVGARAYMVYGWSLSSIQYFILFPFIFIGFLALQYTAEFRQYHAEDMGVVFAGFVLAIAFMVVLQQQSGAYTAASSIFPVSVGLLLTGLFVTKFATDAYDYILFFSAFLVLIVNEGLEKSPERATALIMVFGLFNMALAYTRPKLVV